VLLQNFVRERLDFCARNQPEQIALSNGVSFLTFSELRNHVISRAGELNSQTSPREGSDPIALLVDHSVDSGVTLLAALAAGIPCCPIDSNIPAARLKKVVTILGSERVVSRHASLLSLNGPFAQSASQQTQPRQTISLSTPKGSSISEPLVMLSSGSTGSPKAIVLPDEAVMARINAFEKRLTASGSEPKLLAVSPFHFIAGFLDLVAVLSGASVWLHDPRSAHPRAMADLLQELEITQLTITPALARLISLSVRPDSDHFQALRVLALMGDVARFEDLTGLASVMEPGAIIRQIFGATEARPSFVYEHQAGHLPQSGQIPLGELCDSVNTHLEPMGNGLVEIWRKGPIVDRYLHDEKLTLRHFARDSHGVSWWKSGDLITQDPSGAWFFHSRLDDTIKVRGVLASPSEAQAALTSHPEINVAIILVDTRDNRKRFIAHIETTDNANLTEQEVREYLKGQLPDFLVPARVIVHEKFPVNARGKVDRQSLRLLH
jgi:acyl-CoA synthetase (AMP-forming)/AMP-acid ligase II